MGERIDFLFHTPYLIGAYAVNKSSFFSLLNYSVFTRFAHCFWFANSNVCASAYDLNNTNNKILIKIQITKKRNNIEHRITKKSARKNFTPMKFYSLSLYFSVDLSRSLALSFFRNLKQKSQFFCEFICYNKIRGLRNFQWSLSNGEEKNVDDVRRFWLWRLVPMVRVYSTLICLTIDRALTIISKCLQITLLSKLL